MHNALKNFDLATMTFQKQSMKSTTNLQKLANHRLNKPTSGLLGGGPVSKTMSLVFLPSTFFIENELKQVLAVEALSREC